MSEGTKACAREAHTKSIQYINIYLYICSGGFGARRVLTGRRFCCRIYKEGIKAFINRRETKNTDCREAENTDCREAENPTAELFFFGAGAGI